MKLLFLLWITFRGALDASILATAAWCVLYSFSNISWLECFGIILALLFFGNLSFIGYIRTHTSQDCFASLRRDWMSVGLSIFFAPIIAIFPTVAAIVLLSFLQVWTNLETHWLHSWLLVTCLVYTLLRRREKRRMAVRANGQQFQTQNGIWKPRIDPTDRIVAKEVLERTRREEWGGSQASTAWVRGSARKPANTRRSVRVIDV